MPKYFCTICGSPQVPKLVISTVAIRETHWEDEREGRPPFSANSAIPLAPPTASQRTTKNIIRATPNIIIMP